MRILCFTKFYVFGNLFQYKPQQHIPRKKDMIMATFHVLKQTFGVGLRYLVALPKYATSKLFLNFENAKTQQHRNILNEHLLNTLGIEIPVKSDRRISPQGLSWDISMNDLFEQVTSGKLNAREMKDYEKICAYITFFYITMRNFPDIMFFVNDGDSGVGKYGVGIPYLADNDKSIIYNIGILETNFLKHSILDFGAPMTNEQAAEDFFKGINDNDDMKNIFFPRFSEYLDAIGYLTSFQEYRASAKEQLNPTYLLKVAAWKTPLLGLIVPKTDTKWVATKKGRDIDLDYPSPSVVKYRLADFFRCFITTIWGRVPDLLPTIENNDLEEALTITSSKDLLNNRFLRKIEDAIKGGTFNTSTTFDLKPLTQGDNSPIPLPQASADNSDFIVYGSTGIAALLAIYLISKSKKN